MPWADYRCPYCYTVVQNHVYAMVVGAVVSAPPCPACVCPQMEWIPMAQFDTRTDGEGGKAFQKFDVYRQVPTRDGLVQQRETVDSLHKLRQIEADSEQRFRNGEGEPMRFRMWNQTGSNRDVNSFGTEGTIGEQTYDSGTAPVKSGKVGVTRHGQTKPNIPLGPGLRRAGSPLKG